jgi:hypothetical protein
MWTRIAMSGSRRLFRWRPGEIPRQQLGDAESAALSVS